MWQVGRALPGFALLATACFVPEYQAAQGAGGGSTGASGATGGMGGAANPFGQALHFSGARGRIEAHEATSLDLSRLAFTVELWFQPENLPIYQALVVHGASNVPTPGWSIYANEASVSLHTSNGTMEASVGAAAVLEVGHKHHIAVTRQGDAGHIWVRDATEGETAHAHAATDYVLETWPSPLTEPFELGGTWDGARVYFPVEGVLDDVRIWGEARTDQEINQNAEAPVVCGQAGLIAYWSMDETRGNVVHHCDGSGNLDLVIEGDGYEWVPSPF